MTTYKRSSYDLFIHKVLLPNIRTILLVMAVVALGCGSWLETHPTTDCGFQTAMSVFEVSIYQNISDRYALTPSSVTFGLWKHCFYYAQNCSCTPISLGYEIDAEQSIFAATNNLTMPSVDTSQSSYIRLIPLILALVLSVSAFAYSFWATRTCPLVLFYINGCMSFVGAVLVAIAFGATFQSYRSSIIKACQAANMQSVRCASMAPKLEVTFLAVALGLLLLASALFGCVRKSETAQDMYGVDEKQQVRRHSTYPQVSRKHSRMMKSSSHLSDNTASSKEPDVYMAEAWRDEGHGALPLRSPPVTPRSNEHAYKPQNNNTNYDRRSSSNTRTSPTTTGTSSHSSTLLASIPSTTNNHSKGNEKRRQRSQDKSHPYRHPHLDFTPPTLPFGDYHHTRRNDSQPSTNQFRPNSHAPHDDSPLEDQQQSRHYSDASPHASTPYPPLNELPYRTTSDARRKSGKDQSYHPSRHSPHHHKSNKDDWPAFHHSSA